MPRFNPQDQQANSGGKAPDNAAKHGRHEPQGHQTGVAAELRVLDRLAGCDRAGVDATNAATASRVNNIQRFTPGTASKAKLSTTPTVAVSQAARSSAVVPGAVGGTLRAASQRTQTYSRIQ